MASNNSNDLKNYNFTSRISGLEKLEDRCLFSVSLMNLQYDNGATPQINTSLALQDSAYSDATYAKYTEIPSEFVGMTAIQTIRHDHVNTASNYISFDVDQNVRVYLADIGNAPSWASDWSDTTYDLKTSNNKTFNLYSKDFGPGSVVLPGLAGVGGSWNYTVLVESVESNAGVGVTGLSSPSTGKTFGLNESVSTGDLAWIDRNPEYIEIPSVLEGALAIQTTKSDHANQSVDYVQFTLSADATVYIADGGAAPGWAQDWTATGLVVKTQVPGQTNSRTLNVYSKEFSAGQVTLGGHSLGASNDGWTYTIFVKGDAGPTASNGQITVSNIVAETGAAEPGLIDSLAVNDKVWIDRDPLYNNVPQELLGAVAIQTAKGDNGSDANNYLSFDVDVDATVYIAESGNPGVWASDWTDTGMQISTKKLNGDSHRTLNIFAKDFAAGTVTLPGHMSGGANDTWTYTVLIDEADSPVGVGGTMWSNAIIGGGGRAVDVLPHPSEQGLVYARSDVGGLYRMDSTTNGWKSLTDWLPTDARQADGVDAFAIDTRLGQEDTIYAGFGRYASDTVTTIDYNGLWRSTDRGDTWDLIFTTQTVSPKNAAITYGPFAANGGKNERFINNSITVDPFNSNIVYVGTRNDGLWRTTNAKAANPIFQKISSMPDGVVDGKDNAPVGVRLVQTNPDGVTIGSGSNLRAKEVYALARSSVGNEPNFSGGIFQSMDGGLTFSLIGGANAPDDAYSMRFGEDGLMYVSTSDGIKTYDGNVWVTLPNTDSKGFFGMDVLVGDPNNPNDSDRIVAFVSSVSNTMMRSEDGGQTWETLRKANTIENNDDWMDRSASFTFAKPTSVRFDPFDNTRFWAGDSFGPNLYTDAWEVTPTITPYNDGFEVTVITSVALGVGDSGVEVYASIADIGGMALSDLDAAPTSGLGTATNGLDFMHNSPQIVTIEGRPGTVLWVQSTNGLSWTAGPNNGIAVVWISEDSGATWRSVPVSAPDVPGVSNTSAGPAKIAVSSSNPNHAVFIGANRLPRYTTNLLNGDPVVWSIGTGIPANTITDTRVFGASNISLVADPTNGDRFYFMKDQQGGGTIKIYVTDDGGATWTERLTNVPKHKAGPRSTISVVEVPGQNQGAVYLSSADKGLWRSDNGGVSFQEVGAGQIVTAEGVTFGVGRTASSPPAMYVTGRVMIDGVEQDGMFISEDLGQTFVAMTLPGFPVVGGAGINDLQTDPEDFGVIYIATQGKGILRGEYQV